ncbi:hypothetical protein JCGZ_11934 [Jatropha curcas]|uniref:Uncharacterized protein n=1 Tax=Jatropha curcas TaxID=180498 RepID=A0A067KHH3_JATCU|nr:hypothetical protein JCGZ_11934 [Jatropha curcas]
MSGSYSSFSGTMTTKELELLIELTKKYKKLKPKLLRSISQSSLKKEKAMSKIEKAKEKKKKTEKETVSCGKEKEKEEDQGKKEEKKAETEKDVPRDKGDFVDLRGNEPEETRKDKEDVIVDAASDAETEKLDISDEEEIEPKTEAKKTLAQKNRESALAEIEKQLIKEHNNALDEAIKLAK